MKKLLIFLMILIPLAVIFIVNVTVDIVGDIVTISVDKITLDVEDYEANINDSFKLNATIYPEGASDKKILWSSSDESIATVDENGNVTFVSFGAVNIIAKSADGLKSATCRINITDTRVHAISIFSDKTSLKLGETTHIWASVIPLAAKNQDYVLKSSNESVISINASGIATAKKVGTAIITATSKDGNYEASIEIDVRIPAESISLIPEEETITIASQTFLLQYNILPLDATNKNVIFSSSDPSTATVDNTGKVTFLKVGEVSISATTVDGNLFDSIKIKYTGGYPVSLYLETTKLNFDITSGKTNFKINYTLSPADTIVKNVSFSSNDPKIAKVNENGLVEILSGGSVTISIKVQTGEDVYIYDSILIEVKQDIQQLRFEDERIVTATNTFKLTPTVIPYDSTNLEDIKFRIISGSVATISENGTITFTSIGTCVFEAYIENTDISATIEIYYSGGYPTDFSILNENITLNVGESENLNFSLYPISASIKNFRFEIYKNLPNHSDDQVITLDQSGKVVGCYGGKAIVRLFVMTDSGEIYKDFNIEVIREISGLELGVFAEVYDNYYISGENAFEFSLIKKPDDASYKDIIYTLSDYSVARIIDNKVLFNQAGKVELTATVANTDISHSVKLWFTGGYVVYADVLGETDNLIANQSNFSFTLTNIIPKNATNKSFTVLSSNEQTLNERMFAISYNDTSSIATVSVVGSGTATLSVVLAGSSTPIYSKNVVVQQKVSKIEFITLAGRTPSTSIFLKCNVIPANATIKDVMFTLDEKYSSIAYIKNSTLYFYPSTNASETVVVIATLVDIDKKVVSKSIEITSTFGVVDAPEGDEIILSPNNSLNLDYSAEVPNGYEIKIVISDGKDFVEVVNNNNKIQIKAISEGHANIQIQLVDKSTNEVYKILADLKIDILNKITDINIRSNDLTLFNDIYYTSISEFDLEVLLSPISSLHNVNITISDDSVATYNLETYKFAFKQIGIVDLIISTKDGSLTKTFTIQYTNGKSVYYDINLNATKNVFNINSEQEIMLISYIPSNLNLRIVMIEEVISSGSSKILDISAANEKFFINCIKQGNTNIKITLSDGTEQIIPISVISFIEKIEFSKDKITTGEKTITLNPILTPSNPSEIDLVYVSSNEEIATVLNGIVTFKKAGTVVITVYSQRDSSIKAAIEITSTYGEITDFDLNYSDLNLTAGDVRHLKILNYYPSNALKPEFAYEIITQLSNNNSNLDVIKLENGMITALNGGYAKIQVSYTNSAGETISKTCQIYVYKDLNSIEIEPSLELDTYQNYFVTSRSEIEFSIIATPIDATMSSIEYEVSDKSIATVNNGKIIFKTEGIVTITAKCGNISKSIVVRYSKTIIDYDLRFSKTGTLNNRIYTIEIDAGSSLYLTAINTKPSDILNPKFTLELISNNSNDGQGLVCETQNNVISGNKGGTAKFKVYFEGKEYYNVLEIVVLKKAENIIYDSTTITPEKIFTINPTISPADASYSSLEYKIVSESAATINAETGTITFVIEETVEVEIYNAFSGIKTNVFITYSAGYKTIKFDCSDYVFIGRSLNLSVKLTPNSIADEPVVYEFADEIYNNYATITENGVLVPKNIEQTVKVKAYLKNYPEVSTTISINIYAIVTDLNMEDDELNDDVGIQGKRVYGTQFVLIEADTTTYYNYTKLKYTYKSNSASAPKLLYTSSNTDIAYFNEEGLLFINKPGRVTIKIEPMKQVSNNPKQYISDSYTFTFVEGVNVFNEKEFLHANKSLVIRSDLDLKQYTGGLYQIELKKETANIYGNGHIIKTNVQFTITNPINISNCIIRNYEFSAGDSIMKLANANNILRINHTSNVSINYCLLENAYSCVILFNADASFKGCIVSNSYNAGISINSYDQSLRANNVEINSCVFENNLLGAVCSFIFNSDYSKTKTNITVNGFVDMYTWVDSSIIKEDFKFADNVPTVLENLVKEKLVPVFNRNKHLVREYNGKEYMHMGIWSMEAKFDFEGIGINSENNTTVNFNTTNNPYSLNIIHEKISSGYVEFKNYSLVKDSPYFIKPGMSYKDNPLSVYEKIRRYAS